MRKVNIGILTFLISKAGCIPVSNLLDVVCPLSDNLYLITGNEGYTLFKADKRIRVYGIIHKKRVNIFARVLRYIYAQLEISYMLLKTAGNVDIWIFFISGEGLVLPMLTAKLIRTKVVLALAGFPTKGGEVQKDPLSKASNFLSKINLTLSNRIVAYSEKIVEERGLEKYRNKNSIAHEHFLDFNKFRIKKKFNERENLVGYIGRLSEEKGVLNFVKAIPMVLGDMCEIRFLIGGDGPLREEIEKNISKENLNDKIELTGWIPHDKLPDYLNELKLVVLPSYTEGLPNLMLEAMACGTPVLATPVGAIPDVIKDRKTGFIMKDNSSECIGENVERALNYPDLEGIVKNARKLVEEEFTYEATVEKYRKILEEVYG